MEPFPEITVGEIIDRLLDYDRDAKVRLAINPFFPMAHRLTDVVAARDENGDQVVFLAESMEAEQFGHLPPDVAVQLTWHAPVDASRRRRRAAVRPREDK